MPMVRVSNGGTSSWTGLYPLTLSYNVNTNGQTENAHSMGINNYIVPTDGINHLKITQSGRGNWTLTSNTGASVSIGNNVDVSDYQYLKVNYWLDWFNNSMSESLTFTYVD